MDNRFSGQDRRKYCRVDAKFLVDYKLKIVDGDSLRVVGRVSTGVMHDISVGGLCLLIDSNLPLGSEMDLDFTIYNSLAKSYDERMRKVRALSKICYNISLANREHRVGLEFKNVSKEDKVIIGDYVNANKAK